MAKQPRQPAGSGDRRQSAREQARLAAAKEQQRRRRVQIIIVAAVVVVALGIVGSAILIGQLGHNDRVPVADTTTQVGGAATPFRIDGSAFQVGADDAKVTLDLWVDYSCPHCQEFEAASNATINELVVAKTLKVRYHNIQIVTAYGAQAGGASACVATYDASKWDTLNAALYSTHDQSTDGWQGSEFRNFAAQQGITSEDALSCIDEEKYQSWITDNTEAAGEKGVTGTPTLFLNDTLIDTPATGAELKTQIEQLAQQG